MFELGAVADEYVEVQAAEDKIDIAMNLATLERMVHEGDLSREAFVYLLDCRSECEWLDYKLEFEIESDYGLCAFARDAVAMKNVGGGYLLVGVKDKTWERKGLLSRLAYDAKQLRDKLRRATGLELEVDIVHHELYLGTAGVRYFPLILVRGPRSRKINRLPSIIKSDFCQNHDYGFRRGEIWVRKGDSTVRITSEEELSGLLEGLGARADESAIESGRERSPFAINEPLFKLLPRGYETFIGRGNLREQLKKALLSDPRIWIVNVHGPGGVGKSALVNWLAYEMYASREFEAILQLTAKDTILTTDGIQMATKSLYSFENLIDNLLKLFDIDTDGEMQEKQKRVVEFLCTWKTLLILDNMETVHDGRILDFVQTLPQENRSKVLLTSRVRSSSWELPIQVNELRGEEVEEFIRIKAVEMQIVFPVNENSLKLVNSVCGGLPLAIQWTMGQYKKFGRLYDAVEVAMRRDAPILEFSFRNIWTHLTEEGQKVLSIMSLFEVPPTLHELCVVADLSSEQVEKALTELIEVTLVNRSTQQSDGRVLYTALPITMSFAKHQLQQTPGLELACAKRLNRHRQKTVLDGSEVDRFKQLHDYYGVNDVNEKRAIVLCKRGESDYFAGRSEQAELLFKQAKDLAPNSAVVLALFASFELQRKRVGAAKALIDEACKRSSSKSGAMCYTIKARIHEAEGDRSSMLDALKDALEHNPEDYFLRHQFGVKLSQSRKPEAAVVQFDILLRERSKVPLATVLMALITRIINLLRIGRREDARKDFADAEKLIQENPELTHSAYRLRQLSEQLRN